MPYRDIKQRQIFGIDHYVTRQVATSLSRFYRQCGKLDKAEKMCQFAQGGLREKRGPELNLALYAKTELGRVYTELGKLKDAEEMYKEAREKLQIAVGPEHLGIYITSLYSR